MEAHETPLQLDGSHRAKDCAADPFKTREVPSIREVLALLRLYGLHGTVVRLEENAGAIGPILEGQATPVGLQASELLDEVEFAHLLELRQTGDLFCRNVHLPRPPAARGATLTLVDGRHARNST